jgi:hypothetical protein
VLATDHYVWHTQWSRGAFDLVREHLAPELEVADIDVYDLSPAAIGTFDIVLFTGLLYHMRRPLLAARAGGKRLRRSPDPRDGARRHGPRAPGDGVLPRHRAERRSKQLVGSEPVLRRGHAVCGLRAHHLYADADPKEMEDFRSVQA